MKKRILLVEDEEHLLEGIKLNLELEDYEVEGVMDGKSAIRTYTEQRFDLIILDVMLPGVDGFQVCETIRIKDPNIPILMLTAKNTSEDRVSGLKMGADDYLTKPFNLEELMLRVHKLIQRTAKDSKEVNTITIGKKQVNFANYEVTNGSGKKTKLSKKEAQLLKLLVEREGEAVSREHILETVWGYDIYPSTRTIDNFMLALRKQFEEDPKEPLHFHSVRGVGYKFTN